MKYKKYLPKGIKVSVLGFGAWQLGVDSGWKAVSEKDAQSMIHSALDNGINFFDTAPNYGYGTSELRLGKVFKTIDRSKIVVNSKFGRLDNGIVDFDSKHIKNSVEKSLARLNIDYLDSVIIHSPPIELLDGNKNDHYEILEQLQDEGKIIAYGASIDFYDEIKILLETTNSKVIQSFFNILHQDAKRAFDLIRQKNVATIAKIPFDSGWLTGKYNSKSQFKGVRSRWTKEEIIVRSKLVDKVKEILNNKNSLTAAALSFCTSFDAVSTVIPGAVSKQQLLNNIEAIKLPIDKKTCAELEDFYEREVKELNLPW
jgi:aryl-alcohol dehydrogenase-like predicted oxidoreductase